MLYEKNLRGLRHRMRDLSGNHTIGVEEGGTMFVLTNGAGAYTITLPLKADAGPGWHCSFIVQDATLGGDVTIQDNASDSGWGSIYHSLNDGVSQLATTAIQVKSAATRGSLVEIFYDGTSWILFGKSGVDAAFTDSP